MYVKREVEGRKNEKRREASYFETVFCFLLLLLLLLLLFCLLHCFLVCFLRYSGNKRIEKDFLISPILGVKKDERTLALYHKISFQMYVAKIKIDIEL